MRKLVLCTLITLAACSSTKLTGPTPLVTDAKKQNAKDENPRAMYVGTATPVTVTGDRLLPVGIDTLTDKPGVAVPALYLTNATSTTKLTNVVWVDRHTMTAEIPAGVGLAAKWEDFKIIAEDSAGAKSKDGAPFRVSQYQPPVIASASISGNPAVARFCDTNTSSPTPFNITITGKNFVAPVDVEFGMDMTAATSGSPASTSTVKDTSVVATIPAGLKAGKYDVRVTNADGQRITFADLFTIEFYTCPPPSAIITSVYPKFAYRNEDTMIQISGSGFKPTPKPVLAHGGYSFAVSYPAYLTTTTLQGLVAKDASRTPGWYNMRMLNPGDTTDSTLANALLILDVPIPKVDNVTPDSISLSDSGVITITGSDFPMTATAAVYYKVTDGTLVFLDATINSIPSPSMITATVPLASMPQGVYVLRVYMDSSYGKVYSDYSNIVITGSSGNTGAFANSSSHLVQPRSQFGLTGGRNSIGTRFLYAVGGRYDMTDKTTGLSDVEIAPIDVFGSLQSFYSNPTTLGTPLYGMAVVQTGGWLYAIGGTTPTGISTAIKKAKILDPREAPEITSVTTATGTLGAGNWLYRVSAMMNGSDTANPNGESLASFEVGYDLPAAGGVKITWKPVSNAASYKVYRIAAANGISGTETLLSSGVACCTFTDSGSASVTSSKPLPQGALSVWTSGGTLTKPRAFLSAALASNKYSQTFLYVLGGMTTGGAAENSYEHSVTTVTAGSSISLAAPVNGPGANPEFGRYDASVAVATSTSLSSSLRPGGTDWLAFNSGCDLRSSNTPIGDGFIAVIQPDGTLSGYVTDTSNLRASSGAGSLFTSNRLFRFGGVAGASGCSAFTGITQNIYASTAMSTAYDWSTLVRRVGDVTA